MSVAVCRSSAAACFESILALPAALPSASSTWLSPPMVAEQHEQELNHPTKNSVLPPRLVEEEHVKDDEDADEAERPPGQFDIWSSIQAQKAQQETQRKEEPYVHPLMRRSSSLLSQKSLEICTESLGSETGSDDFFSSDDDTDFFSQFPKTKATEQQQQEDQSEYDEGEEEEEAFEHVERARGSSGGRKELATVNYHCSISRRSSQPRSFPPPLPSISRRDGPCLQMRPHRRDGRLVVEAVTVPSQNYLHAERQNGRLLLSVINTTSSHNPCTATETASNVVENTTSETDLIDEFQQTEEAADEEEVLEVDEEQAAEEEVEVVDRGTVVEVKVSTQPQQNSSGGAATMKVHRSSIVINKFVSCMPANNDQENTYGAITAAAVAAAESEEEAEAEDMAPPLPPVRRLATTSTTTAAAAAVAASSLSSLSAADGSHSSTNDNKLLFTSRRRNREELLHDMRRCSQLRKPLFIWELCCIATSS